MTANGNGLLPHNLDAEAAVIGSALITDRVVPIVRLDEGLRAECFYRNQHRLIWHAIEQLADANHGIDHLTVASHLRDQQHGEVADLVADLPGAVPSVANARTYAKRVVETWRWRARITAHHEALAAAEHRDEDAHATATAKALDVVARAHLDPTPEGARQRFAQSMTEALLAPLPLPWPTLARTFRMRPGATTVIASWTHWGKSWLALELAHHIAANDFKVVVWTNEMAEGEVVARHVQRLTGINSDDVLDRKADPADVATAVKNLAFGIVEAHGWPADELARHIRHVAPDLAIVDHFHQIPGISDHKIAENAVQVLTNSARQSSTHLALVSQLNHQRDRDAERPDPALRDLKSTAALQDLPNNVLFLRRKQETDKDSGEMWLSDEAMLHVAKQRGGRSPRYQRVVISPPKMRITEAAFS